MDERLVVLLALLFVGDLHENCCRGCYVYKQGQALNMPGRVTSSEVVDTGTNRKEMLIGFSDGSLIKIKGSGGKGPNMFKINSTKTGLQRMNSFPHTHPSYLIGSAQFWSAPVLIKYIKEKDETFIAFSNGKVLKVRQTGGSGVNMFAVKETTAGFAGVKGYSYRMGSAKFPASITAMMYVKTAYKDELMVAFGNGWVLKSRGTGGVGYNLFAVDEFREGLPSVKGYNYRIGSAVFSSHVVRMQYVDDCTILALANGQILKFKGTGGSGYNMFAIRETRSGFSSVSSYNLLMGQNMGHCKFKSMVTSLLNANGVLLIGFMNGKLLKVKGSGGTGHNMFDVIETSHGFRIETGSQYAMGWAKFMSKINNIIHVEGSILITLGDGKILKIAGIGGYGPNFLGVKESVTGFHGVGGQYFYEGHARFTSACSDMMYIDEKLLMAFRNGFIVKVKEIGGLNGNMFHIAEDISVGFFNKC